MKEKLLWFSVSVLILIGYSLVFSGVWVNT